MSKPGVLAQGINVNMLIEDINGFAQNFRVADETLNVTEQLLSLLRHVPVGGRQIHDANLVATMKTVGVKNLFTHNVSDFIRFVPEIEILALDSFDLARNQFS